MLLCRATPPPRWWEKGSEEKRKRRVSLKCWQSVRWYVAPSLWVVCLWPGRLRVRFPLQHSEEPECLCRSCFSWNSQRSQRPKPPRPPPPGLRAPNKTGGKQLCQLWLQGSEVTAAPSSGFDPHQSQLVTAEKKQPDSFSPHLLIHQVICAQACVCICVCVYSQDSVDVSWTEYWIMPSQYSAQEDECRSIFIVSK